MKISQNPKLFRNSCVNTSFHGAGGSFQDYTQNAANIVALGRIDLNKDNANKIIGANSPFELRPTLPTKKGILLIHGLFDSPSTLRDIGESFSEAKTFWYAVFYYPVMALCQEIYF